jgi:hypothetical protein
LELGGVGAPVPLLTRDPDIVSSGAVPIVW